jgi:hypothetical protein
MNSITIFFKLMIAALLGLLPNNAFDVKQIPVNNPSPELVSKLQQFEGSFIYPFSNQEEFTIQHGLKGDYFAFFKQLGKPYYYVATSKQNKTVIKKINNKEVTVQQRAGDIAAAVCCICRNLKDKDGQPLCAWYICDLKVNEKYQGEHLPTTMIKKVGFGLFMQCPRGFAICMNPACGEPKAASIFKKHGPIPGIKTQTLNLYNLSYEQALKYKSNLEKMYKHHGVLDENASLGIMSTAGNKDYVIKDKKTNQTHPWHLLHIKPDVAEYKPQEGATHMICAVEGTPLDTDFKNLLGKPSSTAQIISYGMDNVDFNFLTSDQI